MKYGGEKVSTRELSINCMQRMSVGLFKKPIKTINAKTGVKVAGCEILKFPSKFVAAELEVAPAARVAA